MRTTATKTTMFCMAACIGFAVAASEQSEKTTKDNMRVVMATSTERQDRVLAAQSAQDEHAEAPYIVDIGVYGVTLPSGYPDEQWVRFACFSPPKRRYQGLDLMWVDIVVRHRDGVWRTTDEENQGSRGICRIGQGVGTGFIEVPVGLQIRSWTLFVTGEELRTMNVRIGKRITAEPYVYDD